MGYQRSKMPRMNTRKYYREQSRKERPPDDTILDMIGNYDKYFIGQLSEDEMAEFDQHVRDVADAIENNFETTPESHNISKQSTDNCLDVLWNWEQELAGKIADENRGRSHGMGMLIAKHAVVQEAIVIMESYL
jgi:hypothetical protein